MTDPLRRITGLSIGDFAVAHWGVAPLFRRAAHLPDGDFASLLSREAVDELLSQRGLRTPFVRMTRDGEVIPPARYTRSGGAGAEIADQVADDKVLAEFADGATLVLQGLHRMWPPVQEFASALASQLGHPVQVNAYVTPPMNQGLAPHYDVHDVFVLQFAGRKQWRIHDPVWPVPLRDQPWQQHRAAVLARSVEAPLIDCVVESGDMLYLPRGYVHSATSLGDFSGHLTVGVHPVTRQALAEEMFAALGDDVAIRAALPLGLDLADEHALDDEVAATIAALRAALDRVDRVAVARGIGRRLAATTRPAPLRPLDQLALAASVAPDTRVRLRPGLRVTLRTEGAFFVVQLPDREVRFAEGAADAVRAATSGAVVTAATLPKLDVADGVALLVHLLRDGVVVSA
jgi:ribosomal protein L16 Arg81 hydroxylase